MFKAIIVFFLIEYLIPTIWLLIPKLTNDDKMIKMIRLILLGMYLFPVLTLILITILAGFHDLLFDPISQPMIIYPIFIYAFMIRFTFTKKEKDNTEKNIEIEKTQQETKIDEINK